jgi:DNA-binding IclR family transcriptional regulator
MSNSFASLENAADESDRNFVTALARGLDILRCFDQPGVELTVSELARRVGLNQSTVWRLCYTLIKCGVLVQNANGAGLQIGAPALTLGYAAIAGQPFPAIALPYMRQITAQTKGTTTLSLHQAGEMISVQHCPGEFVLPNQPIGWRSSLTSASSGLAILAALPEAERAVLTQQIAARDPVAWPRRLERLERAREDYARFGYVMNNQMLGGQYAIVAVPLLVSEAGATRAWGLGCGSLAALWGQEQMHRAGDALLHAAKLLQPILLHTR